MEKKSLRFATAFLINCFIISAAHAATFDLPNTNQALLGHLKFIESTGDTTPDIAQQYDIGQNAIVAANPGISENAIVRPGTPLTIATQYLLPPLPRQGVIVNLPEMRLYYFPKDSNTVMTFPLGIGKIGKTIPIKVTKITRKTINPTWTPPKDIREFNREQGIDLPNRMGPGPDNPLGPYAIYLQIPTYLIHSTIFPESIGRRASFGCLRMNEDDIKQFFPMITPGTPVLIIDMPNKIAWQNNRLYIEAHPPLEEHSSEESATLPGIVRTVQRSLPKNKIVFVNWQMLAYLSDHPDGIPHEVGIAF